MIIIITLLLNNNNKCHNNAFTYINIDILSLHVKYCLKNEQECIIMFKNSRQSEEFLNAIIHDFEYYERLQNL